jgi:glycosyltransferase involved in cell wall biosynthesis
MGKLIVATDVPGCREVVEHGRTGLLCRAKDAADLAASMIKIANKTPSERQAMGVAGRRKMEREFDERLVIGAYLAALRSIVRPAAPGPETEPLEVTQ